MAYLDLVYPVGSVVFGQHPTIGRWELLPRGYVIETTDQDLPNYYSLRQKQIISQDCLARRIVETNEHGEHSHQNRNTTFAHNHMVIIPAHAHNIDRELLTIAARTEPTYTNFPDADNQIVNKAYKLGTNQGWVWTGSVGLNSDGSTWSAPTDTILYSHRHSIPSTPVAVDTLGGTTDEYGETSVVTSVKQQEVEIPSTYAAGSHKHVVVIGREEPEEFYNKAVILRAYIRIS